jgi:hypothetical protein
MPSKHSILINEQLSLKKEGKRRCCYCKDIFPLTVEHFRLTFNSQLFARACRVCERKKALKRHHQRMKTLNLDDAIRYKLYQAKSRCLKKVRDFTITHEDVKTQWLKQAGRCFYTGMEMTTIPKNHNYFSIDRYDSNRGYTPDNIVLCSHIINLMKKDLSDSMFQNYCQAVVDYTTSRQSVHKSANTTCEPILHQTPN